MRPSSSRPSHLPIGLELYTVRTDLKRDLIETVTRVAKLGYETVEFYSPYLEWTTEKATEVRARLDDLGMWCNSTHQGLRAFTPEALGKTIALNEALGNSSLVIASVPPVADADGWKTLSDRLTEIADALRPAGMTIGYHNNQKEWTPENGVRPMDLIARRTPADVVLQLDVGAVVEEGADPVAWIRDNPGRTRSVHCKDWSRTRGYAVAFGEGDCPWQDIFDAAESVGGVESYFIEHGHSSPEEEFEMARRGLENWRTMRG